MNRMAEPEKRGLYRGLGFWSAVLAVIGNVIGSGVFKKAGPMALELHSSYLVLTAWVLAGLVTLAGALTNLEVAGLIAEPGGQYAFFRHMYGRTFAFLYGWTSFAVIESATIASLGYVFAECVQQLVPIPRLGPEWESISVPGLDPLRNSGTKAVTILAILGFTWANRRGVMLGGYLSNVFSLVKMFGITVLILLGLSLAGNSSNLGSTASSPAPFGRLGIVGGMFSAMLGAFWAYQGWNSITMLGGEVKDARRKIPLAILLGVLTVIAVYLAMNLVYFHILPVGAVEEIARRENSILAVEVVRAVSGEGGARAITLLILLSALGTLHVTILTAARIYFAMGRDGVFFTGAERTHPVYRTPSRALVIQGLWASLLVLTGSFDELTDRLIFAAFLFYGFGALGVFVLRRKMPDAHRPFVALGYPVVPALFVLFCAALVVITIIQAPRDAAFGLILVLLGLPLYYYREWRGVR